MLRVSFTKFLDYLASSGEPKARSAVTAWRQSNQEYDPKRDYHKRVREFLINWEKQGSEPDIEEFIDNQNQKKKKNYKDTIDKYKLWKADKSIEWFKPPRKDWKHSNFSVTLNPELGLKIDGVQHVIKIYLNKNKLSQLKIGAATSLMQKNLSDKVGVGTKFAIFDVKAGEFHVHNQTTEEMRLLLIGEAAHFAAILEDIRSRGDQ